MPFCELPPVNGGELIRSLGPEGTSLQEKNIKRLTPGMVAFNLDVGQQQLL